MKFLALILALACTVAAADTSYTLKLGETKSATAVAQVTDTFRFYADQPGTHSYRVSVKAKDLRAVLEYGTVENAFGELLAELIPRRSYDANGEPIPAVSVLDSYSAYSYYPIASVKLVKGWHTLTVYGYGEPRGSYTVRVTAAEDGR